MKKIKKVLMCRPVYFTVEYIINPWMKPGSVHLQSAQEQWMHLVRVYEKLGIIVQVIDQQKYLPDMVFAADQGIVIRKNVLISNFKYPERQGERFPYLAWFEKHDYSTQFISEGYYFEGTGECLWMGDNLYVGTGFRTTKEAATRIGEALDSISIPLELVDNNFYHLDTCFFPLNEMTAFYYPPAFSEASQKVLQERISQLIPFTKKEVYGFAANNVVVGSHVVTQKGNKTFTDKLKRLGYEPLEVDVSEFIKAGGGIHCLTNILE